MAVLTDLSRINVCVDDLGTRGEGVEASGHAVVKPGAYGDEQVGPL